MQPTSASLGYKMVSISCKATVFVNTRLQARLVGTGRFHFQSARPPWSCDGHAAWHQRPCAASRGQWKRVATQLVRFACLCTFKGFKRTRTAPRRRDERRRSASNKDPDRQRPVAYRGHMLSVAAPSRQAAIAGIPAFGGVAATGFQGPKTAEHLARPAPSRHWSSGHRHWRNFDKHWRLALSKNMPTAAPLRSWVRIKPDSPFAQRRALHCLLGAKPAPSAGSGASPWCGTTARP